MIPNFPPLQSLRAFEAATRHLSYTRAAEELHLTHGAISHHIARLERELGGVRLFIREGHRMILTDAGQVFVLEVRQALQALAAAFENARARPTHADAARLINVSVLPSLAARWLLPRLFRFQAACPGIDVAVRPTASLATLDEHDGVDLAIRYGAGTWAGLKSEKLMKSFIFPVCSPSLLASNKLRIPGDLPAQVLLRNPRQKWRPWFAAAGINAPEPSQGAIYDDASLLLQAAAAGQGVALARSALVADDLASGRLVQLFDIRIEDDFSWHLAWREPLRCDRPAFESLRRWLLIESARDDLGV